MITACVCRAKVETAALGRENDSNVVSSLGTSNSITDSGNVGHGNRVTQNRRCRRWLRDGSKRFVKVRGAEPPQSRDQGHKIDPFWQFRGAPDALNLIEHGLGVSKQRGRCKLALERSRSADAHDEVSLWSFGEPHSWIFPRRNTSQVKQFVESVVKKLGARVLDVGCKRQRGTMRGIAVGFTAHSSVSRVEQSTHAKESVCNKAFVLSNAPTCEKVSPNAEQEIPLWWDNGSPITEEKFDVAGVALAQLKRECTHLHGAIVRYFATLDALWWMNEREGRFIKLYSSSMGQHAVFAHLFYVKLNNASLVRAHERRNGRRHVPYGRWIPH
jgi:hypothetical protein